jgi:hypothetical protein
MFGIPAMAKRCRFAIFAKADILFSVAAVAQLDSTWLRTKGSWVQFLPAAPVLRRMAQKEISGPFFFSAPSFHSSLVEIQVRRLMSACAYTV